MNDVRRHRRMKHHVMLASGSLALLLVTIAMQSGDQRARVSTALAYVALGLLVVTLSLGPRNVLVGRPNPVSSDLRRDCGIWSALVALLHVAVGLTVHFKGQMQAYFLIPAGVPGAGQLRWYTFGLANYAGAVAALGFVLLAVLSSDRWLTRLGTVRWKRWQRSVYLIAAITVVHGVIYIVLERRQLSLVVTFVILGLIGLLAQGAGLVAMRGRQPSPGVQSASREASQH